MKICVISSSVFAVGNNGLPGYGGLEVIAFFQAKGLAELGHKVSLVAPNGSSCPGVTVIPCGPAGQWNEQQSYATYWHHLPEFDVICDHSWQKWSYLLKQEGRLQAPVLGVLHAPVNTMYQSLPPGVDKPCFVCISKDQASHFEALFSRQARVAYNGIDLDFYKPIKPVGGRRSSSFLFLARFSTVKGPDIAIEACRKAEVGLDLVGDTSITNEPELFNKCKAMCDVKLPAYGKPLIRMVGPATRAETVHWYSDAHCMIHPNARFREPLGLAPLESQACGAPVLAWRYGAMSETVKHGETGFLVDSFDELVGLLKAGAVDGLDRVRCRDWVASKFTVAMMAYRYQQLCEEAIQSGGW